MDGIDEDFDDFIINLDGNNYESDDEVDLSDLEKKIEDAKKELKEGESLEEKLDFLAHEERGEMLHETLREANEFLNEVMPLLHESLDLIDQSQEEEAKYHEELNGLNEGYEKTRMDFLKKVQTKTEKLNAIQAVKTQRQIEFKDREDAIREKFRQEREQNRQKLRDSLHESNRPSLNESDDNEIDDD